MEDTTVAFYDGLAADYHLVYGDRWDEAVARQGAVLAPLAMPEERLRADVEALRRATG